MNNLSQSFLVILLFFSFAVNGENYYINSETGKDAHTGKSPEQAFQTFAALHEEDIHPGDSILFARGTSNSGDFIFQASGTKDYPVTFSSYGSGERPVFRNPGAWFVIKLQGDYQTINDLHITDAHSAGIQCEGKHTVISNCVIDDVGLGIAAKGTDIRIFDNHIHDLHMVKNTEGGDDDYGAAGILIGGDSIFIYRNLIENCIADSYDYGVDGGIVELYGKVSHVRIYGNTGRNSDGFFEVGGRDTISDVEIVNNLMIDNGELGGFHFAGKFGTLVMDFKVMNNTLVDRSEDEWQVLWFNGDQYAHEVELINNIFYFSGFQGFSNSNHFHHQHNLYYTTDGTSMGAVEFDSTEISAKNPLFMDIAAGNYTLSSASPAIDAGIQTGIETDYNQKTRVGQPDLGCFEF